MQEYLDLVNYHEPEASRGAAAVFQDIKVWGGGTGLAYQESILSLFFTPLRLLLALFSQKSPTKNLILNGIDGVVKEGEMLLVLGRPGSGCTTLLKTLAGLAASFSDWSGAITYYGVPIDAIKRKFRGEVVYNAEGMFCKHETMHYSCLIN
jgi:ATP-binding cassette subfamily G (WHITE) protein 2 (SNQ2)